MTDITIDLGTLISLLITGGGAWALYRWINLFLSRRRIRVRILKEHYDPVESPNTKVELTFEVTNYGDKPTALTPSITVKALDAHSHCPIVMKMEIEGPERELKPHVPRIFKARNSTAAGYIFSWYRRYIVPITRGNSAICRRLNAQHHEIGYFKYWFGYFMFRVFGRLP